MEKKDILATTVLFRNNYYKTTPLRGGKESYMILRERVTGGSMGNHMGARIRKADRLGAEF